MREIGTLTEREGDGVRESPEIPICAAPNETSARKRRMGY